MSRAKDTITTAEGYHVPVLLRESLDQLITDPNGIYIDVTFGGGGHSREILKRLGPSGHLFGVDRDLDSLRNCDITDERFTFVRSDFRYIAHFMDYYGVEGVSGILGDLGVSSHHLDDEERGFSFRFDAPVDMRMNQAAPETAADLIYRSSLEELTQILKDYGEVKGAYKIAKLMKAASTDAPIPSIQKLLDAIAPAQPPHDKKGLARVFQALRIAVNDEMGALSSLLEAGRELILPDGHFVVITYHSLEDRPVKNFFRTGNISGERITDTYGALIAPFEPLYSKPTLPSDDEISSNPRARSAKLRTAVRLK